MKVGTIFESKDHFAKSESESEFFYCHCSTKYNEIEFSGDIFGKRGLFGNAPTLLESWGLFRRRKYNILYITINHVYFVGLVNPLTL